MADPIIKLKRSAVPGKIPTTTTLPVGEFAINTYDGKVYIQQDQGGVGIGSTVVVINPWSVGLGSTAYNLSFTAGSVGIGTTIPTAKLHIVGDTLITGVTTTTSLSMGGNTVSSLGVGIATAGGLIGVGATILDFRGAGISTITVASGIATINVTGGGSGGGASVSISTTAPVSPSAGDLWYNSNLGRTFIYYNDGDSSQWVDAAPFNIPEIEPPSTPAKNTTTFTATAGQTTFVVSYTIGYIDVYLNGIRLSSNEFAESGSSVILLEAASEGDVLDVVEYTMGIGATGPAAALTIAGRSQVYTTNLASSGLELLLRSGIGTATI